MACYLKHKSLAAQIRDAEQQVLKHQQGINVRAAMLACKIHQRMTAPATLLLAGGIGFIIGELTLRQPPKSPGTADKPRSVETSPLTTALNLITSVRTLYMALPIAWMMKSFHQPDADRPSARTAIPQGSYYTGSCRRSSRR